MNKNLAIAAGATGIAFGAFVLGFGRGRDYAVNKINENYGVNFELVSKVLTDVTMDVLNHPEYTTEEMQQKYKEAAEFLNQVMM